MLNKKGSVSVFLIYILAAMIGITAAFVYAAKQKAYTGICDGILNLSMRSVLSEYDLTLFERYGLMAFEKSGMQAALEINDYVDYAFENDMPVSKTQISFGNYSMADVNNLKAQILEYMKISAAQNVLEERINNERADFEDRTLRNTGIIENLPSKPYKGSSISFIDKIEHLKTQAGSVNEILNGMSDTYFIDTYIMHHFKYATGGPLHENSFFQHEVEYILAGELSNQKNRERIESALKLLRIAMNTAYLYSDERRCAQTLAAAELLTPGTAPATQAVIITTWATAEAANDIKLLLKGKPVPFVKTDASWATSLDNVLNNISEGCIDTGIDNGLEYDDYLMLMLHFQDENIKLARIADLIQINMKGIQDRDFLMKTCNSGFSMTTEIYGKEYSYETCY